MPRLRWHISVRGQVQGVGFRYFTVDAAQARELTGWVANRPDGRVEMEVQGDQKNLESFQSEIRQGPPLSRVTDLLMHEMPLVEKEEGFGVRY